jgi:hypothetical protein
MKVQLLLIGVVGVLSLGALTLADSVPLAHASPGAPANSAATSPEASPSPDESPEPTDTPEASASPEAAPTAHPCNHGFYVSEAAHGHHGGAYTSQIARSDLGKNGDCTAPLPTPSTTSASHGQGAAESDQEVDTGS